jgi:uncharacterized protein (DUF2141 family)
MNRRVFLGAFSVVGAAGFVAYAQPTEEQINDLESQVDELDQRVSALETQVAEGDESDAESSDDGDDSGSESSVDASSLEGAGNSVSDKFQLNAGNYRVQATVDVDGDFDGFSVGVYDPSDNWDLLFNEIIESSGTAEFEAVYEAPEDGQYYVEVSNTNSAWTLSFAAL